MRQSRREATRRVRWYQRVVRLAVQTSGVGLADGLADLVHQLVGELHGVGHGRRHLRQRRPRPQPRPRPRPRGRQAPLALGQHLLELLGQRRTRTYHTPHRPATPQPRGYSLTDTHRLATVQLVNNLSWLKHKYWQH